MRAPLDRATIRAHAEAGSIPTNVTVEDLEWLILAHLQLIGLAKERERRKWHEAQRALCIDLRATRIGEDAAWGDWRNYEVAPFFRDHVMPDGSYVLMQGKEQL